jgi:hypothetical protein
MNPAKRQQQIVSEKAYRIVDGGRRAIRENGVPRECILRGAVAVIMILLAAVLRIVPHPWNLTPIGAVALFSGSMFSGSTLRARWIAFGLPLACLFAGDVFVGFHKLMLVVYASFAVSVALGRWLGENRSVGRIGGVVFLGAIQFFVVTNFAVWVVGFYPKTVAGLVSCFVAGIPYFWNTLAGDALYAGALFGGYALLERSFAEVHEHSGLAKS